MVDGAQLDLQYPDLRLDQSVEVVSSTPSPENRFTVRKLCLDKSLSQIENLYKACLVLLSSFVVLQSVIIILTVLVTDLQMTEVMSSRSGAGSEARGVSVSR